MLDEEVETLKRRFRRISYPQEAAAGRQERLSVLAPVAAASSGWGVEAVVVSNFDEERMAAVAAGIPGGRTGVEVAALSLEEIFIALAGAEGGRR